MELNDKFIHFFCFCPLGLTIKLNCIISKATYWTDVRRPTTGTRQKEVVESTFPKMHKRIISLIGM